MVEGEQWLKRAARRGHAGAQYALARAYLRGIDLPPDIFDAVRWLQAAAWQGNAAALLTLGDLAAKGTGFPAKDPVRAWVCDDLAAQQGAAGAESARDLVAKAMPPRQLARARQIAQDLRDLGGM
jgi:TPR repeat protein